LILPNASPGGVLTGHPTAEAVRTAFLNCGMFYEARLKESLERGKRFPFLEDLKGILLARLGQQGSSGTKEGLTALLQQLETHQQLYLQSGQNGPLGFWLPFGEQAWIEGFVKRYRNASGDAFLLTLNLPLLDSERLLVTIQWRPRAVEIDFVPGPAARPLLRRALPTLEEHLGRIGYERVKIRLSRRLPRNLGEELRGVRFVESYG
jgi:hypothetical protein